MSNRRCHTDEINKERLQYGEYHTVFKKLKKDPVKFQKYTRMKLKTFSYILSKIKPYLENKNWTNFHNRPILSEERLVVTLRFLATGMSYFDLSISFRMGVSTIHGIVHETMTVIWDQLHPSHMPVPTTEQLRANADDFYDIWNLPHCMGAIDVRHIRIKKPNNSGSFYFNYKDFFSITLQAVVDANYKFICIDAGGYGRQHDSTTLHNSQFYAAMKEKIIILPQDELLPGSQESLPFFFIADGAYPLKLHLMKPFVGRNLTPDQQIFNKRLTRARLVVECTFGMLCQKWKIFYTLLQCRPETAELIALAACILHNVIKDLEMYDDEEDSCPPSEADENALMRISEDMEDQSAIKLGSQVRETLKNFILVNPLRK